MSAPREKLLEKLRAILALEASAKACGSIHEAAAAAARAQAIMFRHKISAREVHVAPEVVGIRSMSTDKQVVLWKLQLLGAVADANFCATMHSPGKRDGQHGAITKPSRLHIVGKPGDVDAALYVYNYLVREIGRLTRSSLEKANRAGKPRGRGWANDFRTGAVATVAKRLRELRNDMEVALHVRQNTQALARVQQADADVQAFMDWLLAAGRVTESARVNRVDAEAYHLGAQAAKDIALGRTEAQLGAPAPQLQAGGEEKK